MDRYLFHRRLDNIDFYAPSSVRDKKYDAFFNGKKVSFGNRNYQQFYDSIGFYKDLNHYDPKRRENYRKRHQGDRLSDFTSGAMSWIYLW